MSGPTFGIQSKVIAWPANCLGCGISTDLKPYNIKLDHEVKREEKMWGTGMKRITTSSLKGDGVVYLCPVCNEYGVVEQQALKKVRTYAMFFSLLLTYLPAILLVLLLPGLGIDTTTQAEIVPLVTYGWIALTASWVPYTFWTRRSEVKNKQPYDSFMSFVPSSMEYVINFQFRNKLYYNIFKQANQRLDVTHNPFIEIAQKWGADSCTSSCAACYCYAPLIVPVGGIALAVYFGNPIDPLWIASIGYGVLVFVLASIFESFYWTDKVKPAIPPYYGDTAQVVVQEDALAGDSQATPLSGTMSDLEFLGSSEKQNLQEAIRIAKERGLYLTRKDRNNPDTEIPRLRCPACNYVYDLKEEWLQDGVPICPSCERPFGWL
ncbi:MAG: hypothetical protein EAX95_06900 [Candidatus Thorarchaeota archaeon]|nr:hypothetical protein [Candidatus Thorarchaeota archaeon]